MEQHHVIKVGRLRAQANSVFPVYARDLFDSAPGPESAVVRAVFVTPPVYGRRSFQEAAMVRALPDTLPVLLGEEALSKSISTAHHPEIKGEAVDYDEVCPVCGRTFTASRIGSSGQWAQRPRMETSPEGGCRAVQDPKNSTCPHYTGVTLVDGYPATMFIRRDFEMLPRGR